MVARYGETLARKVAQRIHEAVANTAAITAIPATDRIDGMLVVETTNRSMWVFDDDGTAVAGDSVLAVDAGSGQWVLASGGAAAVGGASVTTVIARTTAALPANTRTANTLTADANGALAAQDGVTLSVGDAFLVANEGTAANNGIYQVVALGGASAKWSMTRIGDFDASAEVTAGILIYVSEGTLYGNEWAFLTTDDPITLNTTALAFAMLPNLTDLASTANGLGASLVGIEDAGTYFTATDVEAALAELGAFKLIKRSVTITSADLTTAGVGPETENIGAVLPTTAVVVAYRASLGDAFDNGSGVSLAMEIGHDNDPDAYEDGFDCFTGSTLEGVGWTFVTPGPGIGAPAYDGTSTGQCVAVFTAGADQLANFTNGSVTVEVIAIDVAA